MKLTETKGDVKFFETETGALYQQIGEGKVEPVYDGEMRYKYIKKVGIYFIKYNENGVHGFTIFNKADVPLEDNIWSLNQAIDIAKEMQQ